jgi:carbamoyl-phosphate synthase large subunit
MMKRKLIIAVTGLNATDNPGPGIAVIRALRESESFEARIIGLSYETLEPGIYMHWLVDKTYQLPLPSAGVEDLYKRLEQICQTEKIDVLIPNFDSELFNFIRISDWLRRNLKIHTFLPTENQLEERAKHNLADFGSKYNVSVPESEIHHNTISLMNTDFTYPFVVKGKFYDATTVYSREQAVQAFNRIAAKWGTPVIVQKFIHGQEINVTAVGDGDGNTLGYVPMRKQYITDKGKAWSGVSIQDDELEKITRTLMGKTKWRGGLELEIIRTDDATYYLIEINPRFPAWIYFANGCGQNHPELLVNLALGLQVKPLNTYEPGKLFIRYSYDMIVDLKEFEKISTSGEL